MMCDVSSQLLRADLLAAAGVWLPLFFGKLHIFLWGSSMMSPSMQAVGITCKKYYTIQGSVHQFFFVITPPCWTPPVSYIHISRCTALLEKLNILQSLSKASKLQTTSLFNPNFCTITKLIKQTATHIHIPSIYTGFICAATIRSSIHCYCQIYCN